MAACTRQCARAIKSQCSTRTPAPTDPRARCTSTIWPATRPWFPPRQSNAWDPDGIDQIYGAAIDNGFMWLASGGGITDGYTVPEPSSCVLLLGGLVLGVLCGFHRRARYASEPVIMEQTTGMSQPHPRSFSARKADDICARSPGASQMTTPRRTLVGLLIAGVICVGAGSASGAEPARQSRAGRANALDRDSPEGPATALDPSCAGVAFTSKAMRSATTPGPFSDWACPTSKPCGTRSTTAPGCSGISRSSPRQVSTTCAFSAWSVGMDSEIAPVTFTNRTGRVVEGWPDYWQQLRDLLDIVSQHGLRMS